MPKIKFLILSLILMGYALLYMATSKETCFEECEKIYKLNESLKLNRPYVLGASRCVYTYRTVDSLCVQVKDTIGINWNLLADTVCMIAAQKGLLNQKVLILVYRNATFTYDTLAYKQCP